MSPIARMWEILVRIWMSTLMKPRSVTATPALSAAIFLLLGVRPKAQGPQHEAVHLRRWRRAAGFSALKRVLN